MTERNGEGVPVSVPPCDLCGKVQTALGALLFSPPAREGVVVKKHVCVACYEGVVKCSNYTARLWSPRRPTPEDPHCVNCGVDHFGRSTER